MNALQRIPNYIQSTWQRGRRGKITIGCGGLVLLCGICFLCSFLYSLTPSGQESAARVAQQNTATAQVRAVAQALAADQTATQRAQPTNTHPPSRTPQPTSNDSATSTVFAQTIAAQVTSAASALTAQPAQATAPSAPAPALIPGLHPHDVTVNLEQRGFTCSSADQGALYFTWTCNWQEGQADATVLIYGRTLQTVDLVDSTVMQSGSPTEDIPLQILGFIATLPFDNADPANARAWVENEFPKLRGIGDAHETQFGGVKFRLYGIPTARTLELGDLTDGEASAIARPTITRAPLPAATNPSAGGGNFDGPVGVCTTGCSVATPPAGCVIKGNVNSDGEKIYHVPGQQAYDKTQIIPEQGDAWFCTQAEARTAGFRAAER